MSRLVLEKMNASLSEGAIDIIMKGGNFDKPVLQILGFKKIPGGASERYRVMISDGKHYHAFAMLATQLNGKILSGDIDNNAVIKLDKYICNSINTGGTANAEKRVIIILELTVLCKGFDIGCRLGNPQSYVDTSGNQGNNVNNTTTITTTSLKSSYMQAKSNSIPSPFMVDKGPTPPTMVFPIASLTPYQNKWTIRARVTNKSNIRTWSNSRGEGKLFNMDLVDESGEIRATCFNEACDKFYNMFEVNKVYYIHKATLKSANKQYSSINNDYEMSFTMDTQVLPCYADCKDIPLLQLNFVPISHLPKLDKDSVVDVIGICKSTSDPQKLTQRTTNRELIKRDIILVDNTCHEVNLTLWGLQAEEFNGSRHPVIAIKGVKVSDFGGCSLSCLGSSTLQINPDVSEAHVLRGWFDNEGKSVNTVNVSSQRQNSITGGGNNFITLEDSHLNQLGHGDKVDYYTCKAVVTVIHNDTSLFNTLYMACPSDDCNKKVVDMANGRYRCEKCNKDFPDFKYRLLFNMIICDFTDTKWVTCFQDSGETILGVNTTKLGQLKDCNNEENFNSYFQHAHFKSFIFRLRVKMENYNDEMKLRTSVVECNVIKPIEYSHFLIASIKKLSGQF